MNKGITKWGSVLSKNKQKNCQCGNYYIEKVEIMKTKVHLFFLWFLGLGFEFWDLKILEVVRPRLQKTSMPTPSFIDCCNKCTFGTYNHASMHDTFNICNDVSMHKEFSTHNDTSTCNDTLTSELTSTISKHTNNSLVANSINLIAFYIAMLNIRE